MDTRAVILSFHHHPFIFPFFSSLFYPLRSVSVSSSTWMCPSYTEGCVQRDDDSKGAGLLKLHVNVLPLLSNQQPGQLYPMVICIWFQILIWHRNMSKLCVSPSFIMAETKPGTWEIQSAAV